jgi:hypothetical protein
MKAYGGVDVQIHIFLTSALVGGECALHAPAALTAGERAPGTHLIGGCVDRRAGVDDVEKRKLLTISGLEPRILGRPARSQSLHRLRYHRLKNRLITYVQSSNNYNLELIQCH